VNFVGKDDPTGSVKTEFVFGVDEDQSPFSGDGAPASEERQCQF